MIKVTRKSEMSGNTATRLMDVTEAALNAWYNSAPSDRPFIQEAFPHLSADDREFLLTGITPEEWDEIFSKGDD